MTAAHYCSFTRQNVQHEQQNDDDDNNDDDDDDATYHYHPSQYLALDGRGLGEALLEDLSQDVLGHRRLLEGHDGLRDALPLDGDAHLEHNKTVTNQTADTLHV